MADTIPVSAQTTTPQLYGGAYGQVWWCRGPQPVSFQLNGSSYTAQVKSGLITSPYASVDDVFTISVAQDQTFDYNPTVVGTWLRIGAAKINEWLGQRFLVPLTVWSDTVMRMKHVKDKLAVGLIMLAVFAGYCVAGYDDMRHESKVSEYAGGAR